MRLFQHRSLTVGFVLAKTENEKNMTLGQFSLYVKLLRFIMTVQVTKEFPMLSTVFLKTTMNSLKAAE